MYCNNCDRQVPDDLTYCPVCGTQLMPGPQKQTSSGSLTSSGKTTIIVVGVIAAVVVCILLVPLFNGLGGGGGGGSSSATMSESVGVLDTDALEDNSSALGDSSSSLPNTGSGSSSLPNTGSGSLGSSSSSSNAPQSLGSPEAMVRESFEALYDGNADVMIGNIPQPAVEYYAEAEGVTVEEAMGQNAFWGKVLNGLTGFLSDKAYTDINTEDFLEFEISSATSMGANEFEALKSTWNNRISGFGDTFQQGAYVPVTVDFGGMMKGITSIFGSMTGEDVDMSQSASTTNVPCVVINNRWYMLLPDTPHG